MSRNIPEILRSRYAQLSAGQRRLADLILHNPHEAALMAAAQMAKLAQVSEATVVRFAQELGFEGYPDLREHLQHQLLREVRSSERIAVMMEQRSSEGALYEMASQTMHYSQRLLDNISENALEEAVDCLLAKKQVYVLGDGAPGSLIYHTDFWFSRLGLNVKAISQTGRRFFDQIFWAGEDDAALVFAFRRPTTEAMAMLEIFREIGGCSILVTDLAHSRMHGLAAKVLKVERGPMDEFRPLGPLAVLIDAMILTIIRRKGEGAVTELRRLDDLRQRYGQVYKDS